MADRAGANRAPPPQVADSILLRRIAGVVLGIFLYTTASPFSPVSWLTQPDWTTYIDGPRMVDRVLSPILLVGAAILHWYIASARAPLPLTVSFPAGQEIRPGGRVEVVSNDLVLGLWTPGYFWPFAAAEFAVLWAVGSGNVGELTGRVATVGIVAFVWVLGWNAMPWYRKQQAWSLIKEYVVRLIIMELINSAFGGGRDRRRRRRF